MPWSEAAYLNAIIKNFCYLNMNYRWPIHKLPQNQVIAMVLSVLKSVLFHSKSKLKQSDSAPEFKAYLVWLLSLLNQVQAFKFKKVLERSQ